MSAPRSGKVVFVGRVNVGKTALMTRVSENRFNENTESTTACAYGDYKTSDGVTIQFWDTAGMERYRSINKLYYRDAAVCLVVFDALERQSFLDVPTWKREFEKEDTTGNAVLILVGNKTDITDPGRVQVKEDEARQWAEDAGIQYFPVSAKSGEGIFELLEAIVQIIAPPLPQPAVQVVPTPVVIDAPVEEKQGCC
jgi:small GTP-binding protein